MSASRVSRQTRPPFGPSESGRGIRSRGWVFIVNCPDDVDERLFMELCRSLAINLTNDNEHNQIHLWLKNAALQIERGEETGRLHLQGWLYCNGPKTWSNLNGKMAGYGFPYTLSWRKQKGSPKQCWDYCTKSDTRVEGPWIYGEEPAGQGARMDRKWLHGLIVDGTLDKEKIMQDPDAWRVYASFPKPVNELLAQVKYKARLEKLPRQELSLTDWQKWIVEVLEPQPRVIREPVYWYWSTAAQTGKSAFVQWLVRQGKAVELKVGSSVKDTIHSVRDQLSDREFICVTLPRAAIPVALDAQWYTLLEQLSDGMVTSEKYDGFVIPILGKVLVFANYPCPSSQLVDRVVNVNVGEAPLPAPTVVRPLPGEWPRTLVRSNAATGLDLLARMTTSEADTVEFSE